MFSLYGLSCVDNITCTQSKPRARAFSRCGLVARVENSTERKEK